MTMKKIKKQKEEQREKNEQMSEPTQTFAKQKLSELHADDLDVKEMALAMHHDMLDCANDDINVDVGTVMPNKNAEAGRPQETIDHLQQMLQRMEGRHPRQHRLHSMLTKFKTSYMRLLPERTRKLLPGV